MLKFLGEPLATVFNLKTRPVSETWSRKNLTRLFTGYGLIVGGAIGIVFAGVVVSGLLNNAPDESQPAPAPHQTSPRPY